MFNPREGLKKVVDTAVVITSGVALYRLLFGAFGKKTRDEVIERAGGASELTGRTDRPLHASHINHNRESEDYNNPDNGILLTDVEHLAYHINHVGHARDIGLGENQNNWAVNILTGNVLARGVSSEEISTACQLALNLRDLKNE